MVKQTTFVVVATIAIASSLLLASCDPKKMIMRTAVGDLTGYFGTPDLDGDELVKLSEHVYTYRWTWYRSVVIDTDDGLFITDPFNEEAVAALKSKLQEAGLTKPVHTLFYSHYHLDHTEGGAALQPKEVVAHAKSLAYWGDLDASRVLMPTRLIEGDQTLTVGGVTIDLIYLGKSHTDTLYAVYLPDEKLLWTADFVLVRTFMPLGGPDYYFPGAIKGMDRLATLDFDTFIPSHFGYGTKKDFLEYVEFVKFTQEVGRQSIAKFGREVPRDRKTLQGAFDFFYDALKERYGDWRGFEQNVLFTVTRTSTGQRLGY